VGDLTGQVALVTGGGRGIGRAVALGLAEAGAAVALAARTIGELEKAAHAITESGGVARALIVDVTDWSGVQRAVQAVERDLGPITLLVNNAGRPSAIGPVALVDGKSWWQTIRTHLQGTFICTRTVLPRMLERGGGRLVNVTGIAGTHPTPNASDYGAAKAAVMHFTESVAAELAGTGLAVFSIGPGLVRTALTDELRTSPEGQRWLPNAARWDDDDFVPASRTADLVVRLARGDADPLSGRFLNVRDDLDALVAAADEIVAADGLRLQLKPWPPD
jgi:NAD(P)-dependent dehydrogenase (short-subunit alcohol dehydrogenase family)